MMAVSIHGQVEKSFLHSHGHQIQGEFHENIVIGFRQRANFQFCEGLIYIVMEEHFRTGIQPDSNVFLCQRLLQVIQFSEIIIFLFFINHFIKVGSGKNIGDTLVSRHFQHLYGFIQGFGAIIKFVNYVVVNINHFELRYRLKPVPSCSLCFPSAIK